MKVPLRCTNDSEVVGKLIALVYPVNNTEYVKYQNLNIIFEQKRFILG